MPQSVHALSKGERTVGEEGGYEEEGAYARDNSQGCSPGPSRSYSPSRTLPTAGPLSLKRPSSSESVREVKIPRTLSRRPKGADHQDLLSPLVLSATSFYRANLSSACAFPDLAMEAKLVRQVWNSTCLKAETSPAFTDQIAELIKSQGSKLLGELQSNTRPVVEFYLGFETGLNPKTIAKNRKTAENLKEGKGFVYRVPDEMNRKGMYQAKILQKVVNITWFRNKQDEGVVHEDLFSPLTVEALALVLAAIEHCIDEWSSGIRTDIPFSAGLYKDVYEDHIRCLEEFNKVTKYAILPGILQELYEGGRFHAGVSPSSRTLVPSIPISAFYDALKEYEEESAAKSDVENQGGD